MYDIAIIGAGPAGATLARLIGKNYKVLLADKRTFYEDSKQSSITKCCGGLIAPDAQKVIAQLGLGLPQSVLVGPQLFSVRTIDLQSSIERYYQRFYINVDRERFDRWLISMIPSEVNTRYGCLFKSYEPTSKGYKIKISYKGKEYTEFAKIIIGADGAFSLLRKQTYPNAALPKKYISIQEWFEAESIMPYFSAIFDNEITDFYSWTIPKDNCLIIGTAVLPGNDACSKFELLKRKLQGYGFEFGKKVKREGAFILRPMNPNTIITGKKGIAFLGETAGWISPSSAEGLSYAFRSAISMAESLEGGLEGFLDRYNSNTSSLKRNIFIKNIKAPFMYNSTVRNLVMHSGVQSMKVRK